MMTLGIETSCDETAVGIVKDSKILANIVSSQVAHSKYGGVVPEIAARNHVKVIIPILKLAMEVAQVGFSDIDLICATYSPGLLGSLLVGLSFAKTLSIALDRPFVAVNHLEGHIYALRFETRDIDYPYLVLIVSGGHTDLVLVTEEFAYRTIGRTLDDACGEAFDKVAKLIGLPYPGGPYIEKTAINGKIGGVKFPVPKPKGSNFSYAGLKTAVLYYVRQNQNFTPADVAANFQESALEHLVQVTGRVIDNNTVNFLGVVGGVSANRRLREKFNSMTQDKNIKLSIPALEFCTDNAVMIALAGLCRYQRFGPSELSVDAIARQSLDEICVKRNA